VKKRVQLIVTGRQEEEALHLSLKALFGRDVADFLPPLRADGFTSKDLSIPPREPGVKTHADKLAAELVAMVEPGGADRNEADLIIVVEDLELFETQPPVFVVEYFRDAVRRHVETFRWKSDKGRVWGELQRRCSFHLMVPMPEAYFFGEPAALRRAKATGAPSLFDERAHDIEQFSVDDARFLSPPPPSAPWKPNPRHPKHYVRYLCDPSGQVRRAYRETHEGKAALEILDWRMVLGDASHGCFARSFLHDVADALGIEPPVEGGLAEVTERRTNGLLRNV
jgi:hypothetical protein